MVGWEETLSNRGQHGQILTAGISDSRFETANVPAPSGRRGSGDAVNPSGHVGLIGKAGVGCNPAQAVRASRDPQPRRTGSQFGTQHRGCNSVGGSESPRDGFAGQAVHFRPHTDLG